MPNRDTLNDRDLLRLSAKGDEAAFTALYRRHQRAVFHFALHMSGRREVAEEVTQEVFLVLIREPKQYQAGRGPLEAFLIGVARNKLKRHLAEPRNCTSGLDELALSLAAADADPFQDCSKASESRALESAILSLPPRYREAIVLCDLQEMAYADVARLLGCAIGTVRSRLHRARAILAAKLRNREQCSV